MEAMKQPGMIKGLVVCLAVLGFCLPQPLLAAVAAGQAPVVTDVALSDGGVLLGQVVDAQGSAKSRVPVSIRAGDRELAVGKTDGAGYFAFSGLRGGVYQLTAAEGLGAYRLWAPGTAPPAAQPGALIVAGQDLARGNWHGPHFGRLRFWLSNPWCVGALVATAVAVPVIIHNSDGGPASP
jgi:hypothetical protein